MASIFSEGAIAGMEQPLDRIKLKGPIAEIRARASS